MKVLIAGASGLVGSELIPALEAEGAEVTRLVRSSAGVGEIEWHANNDQIDATQLEGFDAIINLAGENIVPLQPIVSPNPAFPPMRILISASSDA